jgi:biotin operon repressor
VSKSVESITKTSRLLVVFHLFRHCQEVSFKEITDMLPVSEKTVYRDIQILKRAGVLQIRYSKRQEAFVPASLNFTEPDWPENQTQRRYLEKIRRLCTLMVQIEEAEDPVAWYRERYPGLSDRTRQRDFKELDKIGYQIGYNPLRNPDRDWDPHYEPGWYYEFPSGAYDITF